LKLGDGSTNGSSIQGLPGHVGGSADTSDNGGGLNLKLGNSSAPASPITQPVPPMGIPGLPGLNLNNVEPSQAAQLADTATTLTGPERSVVEDAALQAAQKNPALTTPSDDPFVTDYQKEAQGYNTAVKQQQEALQKASEAEGHVQADNAAIAYANPLVQSPNATDVQREAFQQMQTAAHSDEDAAVVARQMFEQTDVHLSIVRDRASGALAALAPPPANLSASLNGVRPTTISAPGGHAVASPPVVASSPVLVLSMSSRPQILASPPPGGKPHVMSVSECVASYSPTGSVPSLEELRRKLESQGAALQKLAETQLRENQERNELLKDMRKALQDVSINAIDKGVEGLFDSTKEGLQDAEIGLHGEIMETKNQAIQLRQEMDETRKAMDTAKGDPARLSALNAEWVDLDKNQIQPLLQRRKELEDQWESYFKWQKHVASFTSARDFGIWLTDTELPCEVKDGAISCENIRKSNPFEKTKKLDENLSAEDLNPALDGLKQVMKFAAHNADLLAHLSKAAAVVDIAAHATFIGEVWDTTSMTIDLTYDATVGYLGYQRLQQAKQNDPQFEKAKAALAKQIDRTNAEIGCYQGTN